MAEDTEIDASDAAASGGDDDGDGGLDALSTDVSRRTALGLGGLVATGGLLGSSVLTGGTASARVLDGDLDCDGHAVREVGAIHGRITGGQPLESLAGRNLAIEDGRLHASVGAVGDGLERRLTDAVTRLELVSGSANRWHVGPDVPAGAHHRNGAFGLLFETDRPAYLGACQIDAEEAGQFTPALFEYDRETDALGDQVDRLTVQTTGGPQTVFLDFLVEEPGEYLLTRLLPRRPPEDGAVPPTLYRPTDDPIALRRAEGYGDGFATDSRDGVTFHGGYNPYAVDEPVDFYYYYFDLEVASARS